MTAIGRNREVNEIIRMLRAAVVGRAMLGELQGEVPDIFEEMLDSWTRSQIKGKREEIRGYLRGELRKFCRSNFPNLNNIEKLGELYEELHQRKVVIKPIREFKDFVGGSIGRVFADVPSYANVHIDALWGLRSEFPEHHLCRVIETSYNLMKECTNKLNVLGFLVKEQVLLEPITPDIVNNLGLQRMAMYSVVTSCFALIESFINGIAWEYAQSNDTTTLSEKDRKLLQGEYSLGSRLQEIPRIICGSKINIEDYPLHDLMKVSKPYRDSLSHPSPFVIAKYGDHDKLALIYDLKPDQVETAFELTLRTIEVIRGSLRMQPSLPAWLPILTSQGTLIIPPK